jgi:hypothetical protein
MSKVMADISTSLVGFVTGPNVRIGNGMGDEGDRLHDWKFRRRRRPTKRSWTRSMARPGRS